MIYNDTDKTTLRVIRRIRGRGRAHIGFTWTHLDSLGLTWSHLDSLGFTWAH